MRSARMVGLMVKPRFPSWELIIGKPAAGRDLPADKKHAEPIPAWFSAFLGVFASPDTRWLFSWTIYNAGCTTLDLLEHLVTHRRCDTAAGRGLPDNEVGPAHPFCGRWRRSARSMRGA